MAKCRKTARRVRESFALLALASCVLAGPGGATGTAPPLHVEAAAGLHIVSGTWIELSGTFPGRDMVQIDYPLQVLVRTLDASAAYVWFWLPGAVFAGSGEGPESLADAAEIEALAGGLPEASGAQLLSLQPKRLELQLPAGFPAGPAEAQLFVLYDGSPIFSNSFPFVIEEAAP